MQNAKESALVQHKSLLPWHSVEPWQYCSDCSVRIKIWYKEEKRMQGLAQNTVEGILAVKSMCIQETGKTN